MADSQKPASLAKVFIVGAPRSGTSILVFALKNVFGLPGYGESHVIPVFQRMVHHLRAYSAGFAKIPDPMMFKKLDRLDLEQYLFNYVRSFYEANFPQGAWIDKTPTGEAVFGLPLIESIFPDARLIATKRNGIEVVVSHLKKFNSSFEEACLSWVNSAKGLTHARTGCHNLLEVDQFDFLNATNEVSNRIAEHLGAPHLAKDLAQYFSENRVEGSSTHNQHERIRLNDTGWSDAQKKIFERECGTMMAAFNYEM